MSDRVAKTLGRRVAVLVELPDLEARLAAGETTGEHVDAVAAALRPLSAERRSEVLGFADSIVTAAIRQPVDTFRTDIRRLVEFLDPKHRLNEHERARRSTRLAMWIGRDGMYHLRGAFDPERGSAIYNAVRHEAERVRKQQQDAPATRRSTRSSATPLAFTA